MRRVVGLARPVHRRQDRTRHGRLHPPQWEPTAGRRHAALRHRAHLSDVVHRAQDTIDSRFTERLPLEALARDAGCSPRTLTRTFTAATGMTPLRYQQLLRLEHAEHLIGQGVTMEPPPAPSASQTPACSAASAPNSTTRLPIRDIPTSGPPVSTHRGRPGRHTAPTSALPTHLTQSDAVDLTEHVTRVRPDRPCRVPALRPGPASRLADRHPPSSRARIVANRLHIVGDRREQHSEACGGAPRRPARYAIPPGRERRGFPYKNRLQLRRTSPRERPSSLEGSAPKTATAEGDTCTIIIPWTRVTI
jgi:AraC-like DNA-binding protein